MAKDTREQLLDAAVKLFAEKGFYGATIASIADELGLTKQALLHHFSTKEKLYGEVLARISSRMTAVVETARAAAERPADQLEQTLLALHARARIDAGETRLLMRELLDNLRRAEQAETWYMKAFVDALVEMARLRKDGALSKAEALAEVFGLLGAMQYFTVSETTLRRMYGDRAFEAMEAAYPSTLKRLIGACDV